MVWHFCGMTNSNKIEKIQERALRIVYKDYRSQYTDLLCQAKTTTILIKRLRQMLYEAFKSLKKQNSKCLHDLYTVKEFEYSLRRNVKVNQPLRRTVTFGTRSVSYLGAKLWNDNPTNIENISDVDDHMLLQMSAYIDDLYICNSNFKFV